MRAETAEELNKTKQTCIRLFTHQYIKEEISFYSFILSGILLASTNCTCEKGIRRPPRLPFS